MQGYVTILGEWDGEELGGLVVGVWGFHGWVGGWEREKGGLVVRK